MMLVPLSSWPLGKVNTMDEEDQGRTRVDAIQDAS